MARVDQIRLFGDLVANLAALAPAALRKFHGKCLRSNLIQNAGRVGTGMSVAELERVWQRLQPLAVDKMPLSEQPPRGSRFGSPLVLSRVHWVRPEMVVEVSFAEFTPEGLLRHVAYQGEREDKPAIDVRRDRP